MMLCNLLVQFPNGGGSKLYGPDYENKTGKLYKALQSAGLISKSADNESKDANAPSVKQ